ncbi:hypothetical protein AAH979_29195 [Plantactinospora sp. ZYX-F-223]|uniref:hypothetical protein n=1 Tax=Plantactinospora sp. ZYX-F-223 TaxID=3144103 RepID=UPI0031FBE362
MVAVAVLTWPGVAAAAAPPANDDFDDATTVSGLPFTDVVPGADATTATDDPTACDGAISTVWYRFTPTRTGSYVATGTAEPYGAYLSIFTGTRGALTPVVCSSGTTVWPAEAGTTYYLMVSAFQWSPPGDFVFTLDGPSAIDVTLDPQGRVDPRTGVAQVSGTVTCRVTGWTMIRGVLRQRVGRLIISGGFASEVPVCDGTPRRWAADVTGENGIFAGGRATARVDAEGCPDALSCFSDVAEGTLRLSPRRAAGPGR